MNAICLVVDRLHAGYVGAYGNTWIETPQLDRLAVESLVCDQAVIDSARLERLYRSFWQGIHALCPDGGEQAPTLAGQLNEVGVATTLLTDEPEVARHGSALGFDRLVEIEPRWMPEVADSLDETHLAGCFAELIDWLAAAQGPFLLWCHLSGLGGPWDAPPELRRRYWVEGDPEPYDAAEVPCLVLEDDYDPDRVLSFSQAYAGQVSVLDACVGALLEFIESSEWRGETLLAVLSARGMPLGEHRGIGPDSEPLYGELLHVPWMIRFPDGMAASARHLGLVEPADLAPTLLDWWGVPGQRADRTGRSLMPIARGDAEAVRDRVCALGTGGERAIRTPAWHLRIAEQPELYRKPDDRWEANDVARRCPDVVAALGEAFRHFEQAARSGTVQLSPLDDILLEGLD